ncbi:hypothetical protein [Streptomyces sp. AB3(2024)]|uniref:hypothetical protein n=1 Tax=Streptomyces sp. AB3(2024) TaxID=3317321 RepID=UPI0035A278BE
MVRGTPGPALVDVARDPDDLLVGGTGSRAALRRLVRPSVARYCLAHAAHRAAPAGCFPLPYAPRKASQGAVSPRTTLAKGT